MYFHLFLSPTNLFQIFRPHPSLEQCSNRAPAFGSPILLENAYKKKNQALARAFYLRTTTRFVCGIFFVLFLPSVFPFPRPLTPLRDIWNDLINAYIAWNVASCYESRTSTLKSEDFSLLAPHSAK